MSEIEDDLVRQLRQKRAHLKEKYPLGPLNEKYQPIINEIFKKTNNQALSGK